MAISLTACSPLPKDLEKRLIEAWKKEILDGKSKIARSIIPGPHR